MSILIEELRHLIAAFDENKIEFALCGALAMAVHGFPRATMGIDVLIRKQSLDQTLRIAGSNGFDIKRTDDSLTFRIRRLSKVIGGVVLNLNLLLVVDEIEDVWDSKKQVTFRGHPISVASRDGLIEMKRRAGRPQDMADIYRIENEEVCRSPDVDIRLRQVDQLHTLSVELLIIGRTHYEKLVGEGKASDRDLARFRQYLV